MAISMVVAGDNFASTCTERDIAIAFCPTVQCW